MGIIVVKEKIACDQSFDWSRSESISLISHLSLIAGVYPSIAISESAHCKEGQSNIL